jgi:hypothetical protein
MVPAQPGGVYADVTSLSTLPGQNSAPPSEKIFASHFFVQVSLPSVTPPYYDPSYGVTYMNAQDFEKKAVAGYLKGFQADAPVAPHEENVYWVRQACDANNINCMNNMEFY